MFRPCTGIARAWLHVGLPAFLVLGCRGNALADVSGSYMRVEKTAALLLKMTRTGTSLDGFAEIVTEDLKQKTGYGVRHAHFTGKINGSSFTLHSSVAESLLGGGMADCSGVYDGEALSLTFSGTNGQQLTAKFGRASNRQWNTSLASVEKNCGSDLLRQTWRTSLQTHFSNLQQAYGKAQKESSDLSQLNLKRNNKLNLLVTKKETALRNVGRAKEALVEAKSKEQEIERAANAAKDLASQIPSLENRKAASDANYKVGSARYAVGAAVYDVKSAIYDARSNQQDIDQLQKDMASDQKRIDLDNQTAKIILAESSILKTGASYLKKLANGSLWVATTTESGSIKGWPDAASSAISTCQKGQALSVIPLSDRWCMVLLQNSTIGWTPRQALTIVAR